MRGHRWIGLAIVVACAGCPDDRREQIRAQREAASAARRAAVEAEAAARDNAPPLDHTWPPETGQPYPNLKLQDLAGRPFELASLKGKPLLLHLVGTQSPGSLGFAGALTPFQGHDPQPGLPTIDDALEHYGIDRDDGDFVRVDLLLYQDMYGPPSPEVGRAWAEHLELGARPNVVVLVGTWTYIDPVTLAQIPGVQLVDREFVLRVDAGGMAKAGNTRAIYETLADLLQAEAPGDLRVPALTTSDPDPWLHLLTSARYEELEQAMHTTRAQVGNPAMAERFGSLLASQAAVEALDDWCVTRPESPLAFWARGCVLIKLAWQARGGGWASTVSEEGWELFRQLLDGAERDLERAMTLDEPLPFAPAEAITLAMGQSQPVAQARALFERAIAADPAYYPAYHRMMRYLMPRWHGTYEAMVAFVDEAVASRPDDPHLARLVIETHVEHSRVTRNRAAYLKDPLVRDALEQAFDLALEAFPDDGDLWNDRALIAYRRGEIEPYQRYLQRGAEAGSWKSMRSLGSNLQKGEDGYAQDPVAAFGWYLRAARAGSDKACADVGAMLVEGDVFRPDYPAGIAWFERGAELGNPYSMNWLGIVHEEGYGVEVDLAQAADWYRQAARLGAEPGATNLERLLKKHADLRRSDDAELIDAYRR